MECFKIMDGAMGSELIRRGLPLPENIWSANANITNPDIIQNIHKEYVDVGAEYITTNTFRTSPRAYLKTGVGEEDSVRLAKDSLFKAVAIAHDAADGSAKVIGSIAPLEDCYTPNLFPGSDVAIPEFSRLGKWLAKAGVDIFLLETMNSIAETEAALVGIQGLGLPIWVSFVLRDGDHLLSGDSLIDAQNLVAGYPVNTILLNCNPLDRTVKAAKNLVSNWPHKWGAYPNLGIGEPSSDGHVLRYEKMDCFLSAMEKMIKLSPSVLGACCGSSFKHIAKLFGLRKQYDLVS
jgi:homocysteine S-methyltransferase